MGKIELAKFLRQALIIDTLRGEDSTGMFFVPHTTREGEVADWVKKVGDGYSFVEDELYAERMRKLADYKYLVGHNRAATQGAVNVENAHPFQEGPITLVHNGTLRDDTAMPHSMDKLKVTVDSHAVCHNLALHDNTVKGVSDVVSNIDGAFALIWHDARDDSLNIVRNNERPLHFMQHRYHKTLFFASEAEMLALLAKRIKIDVYEDAHYPTEGQYLKFKGGNILNPETHTIDMYDDWGSRYSEYGANYGGSKKGGSTSKKPEPRVQLGGRSRGVPQVHKDRLDTLGFSVRDQIQFLPVTNTKATSPHPGSLEYRHVTGVIGGTNYAAVIPNITLTSESLLATEMRRPWCVRPVALTIDDEGEPCIICALASTYWRDSDFHMEAIESEFPGHEEMLLYKQGQYISESLWVEKTKGGCECCGLPAMPSEAGDLEWAMDGTDSYMCGPCQDISWGVGGV